jgi:hypothetical protein
MSIDMMNAVFKHSKSTNRARVVMLAIADHQGELGAWPSIETLAKAANASERSVKRDIADLEALGELRVERRKAPTGGQYRANLYWITLQNSDVTDSVFTSSEVTDSVSEVTDSVSEVTAVGPITLNRTLDRNTTPSKEVLFEQFWSAYPKKEGKKPAYKAFQSALTRVSFEDIIAGVIRYKNGDKVKRGFIMLASRWLNEDHWEDYIEPSRDAPKQDGFWGL